MLISSARTLKSVVDETIGNTFFTVMLKYELKIRSCSLFVSPVANFSPWQKIIPLYNFSEFLCQLNNSETLFAVLGY